MGWIRSKARRAHSLVGQLASWVGFAASMVPLALTGIFAGPARHFPYVVPVNRVVLAGPESLVILGHGFGHGRGMGQYGALALALDAKSYGEILAHYYPGAVLARLSGPDANPDIRVLISELSGSAAVLSSTAGLEVGGVGAPAGVFVRIVSSSGGSVVAEGPSCRGPWASPRQIDLSPITVNPLAGSGLEACIGGRPRPYAGSFVVGSWEGTEETMNVVDLQDYLEGVVPSEMPASWGELGGPGLGGEPKGFQALEAQAVAARSYALANLGSLGFADICDTDYCQVYQGQGAENATSNLAVSDTFGVVEEVAGEVAETQYSASTGGWTAPGTFGSVPDPGDSICIAGVVCNQYHDWTRVVSTAQIQAAWPYLGTLEELDVLARDGSGGSAPDAWGGRVLSLELVGSNTTLTVSGAAFAGALGLPSDWFTLTAPAEAAPPGRGSVAKAPPTLVPESSRAASSQEGFLVASASGRVSGYLGATELGSFDPDRLGNQITAMARDPKGGYWLLGADGRVFGVDGASYFGSVSVSAGIRAVGIASSPDGEGYWVALSDGTVVGLGDARSLQANSAVPSGSVAVAIASDPTRWGFWLAWADGVVVGYGSDRLGATTPQSSPAVALAADPAGGGFWLTLQDGQIEAYGNARYLGNLVGRLSGGESVVGLAATPSGLGLEALSSTGRILALGRAPHLAGLGLEQALAGPAVAIAEVP